MESPFHLIYNLSRGAFPVRYRLNTALCQDFMNRKPSLLGPLGVQLKVFSSVRPKKINGFRFGVALLIFPPSSSWVLETAPTLDRIVEGWAAAPGKCACVLPNYITFMSRSSDLIQHCGSLLGCLI